MLEKTYCKEHFERRIEMITHDEARKNNNDLFNTISNGNCDMNEIVIMVNKTDKYITQQEKKDELLGMYQFKDSLVGDVVHHRITAEEADAMILETKAMIEQEEEELK